jgi:hypothetical protein
VIRKTLSFFMIASVAAFAGCASQAPDETESSNSDTSTADTLLNGVHGCMMQSTCAADAGAYGGGLGCSQLGSCLSGLVPNGGGLSFDGGIGNGLPGIGSGLPGLGGLPGIGNGLPGIGNGLSGIGNGITGLGDGGKLSGIGNGLHGSADGGVSAAVQCVSDLGACLKAHTNPATCAEDAIACLKAAKQAGGIL